MKINIFLLLIFKIVFISSLTLEQRLYQLVEPDCLWDVKPGFTICKRKDVYILEQTDPDDNLTIINEKVDEITPYILEKYETTSFYFSLKEDGILYTRTIEHLEDSKELNFLGNCRKINFKEIDNYDEIIDFSKDQTMKNELPNFLNNINGSLMNQRSLVSSDLLNGLCNTLPPVQVLFLEEHQTKTIDTSVWDAYKNITALVLDVPEVENLPPNLLQPLSKLEKLSITMLKIKTFPKETLNNLKSLLSLELEMSLKNFELGTFDGLYSLEILDLAEIGLESLPANIFKDLHNLKHLDLNHNSIKNLELNVFYGLNKLEYLDLSYNNLTDIGTKLFENVKNLQNFNISFNSLTSLKANSLRQLSQLVELNLKNNHINKIEDDALPVESLTSLDLSYNKLTTAKLGFFKQLQKIYKVDLRSNKIKRIPTGVFDDLKNLNVIYMAKNPVIHASDFYSWSQNMMEVNILTR